MGGVSVLEDELRVMNPDMTAIQVRHYADRIMLATQGQSDTGV